MPWLERINPSIGWRIKSVASDNFFYSPSSPSPSPPSGLDSQPSSEVPAPMDGKFPHDEKYSRSHINPNLASKESKESTESNVYLPPIKSSNSPNSAISGHPKRRQVQVPSPLWLYRQPPEHSSHILSDCSHTLYPSQFTLIFACTESSPSIGIAEDFHNHLCQQPLECSSHILSDCT
jgi:hypothetical protein